MTEDARQIQLHLDRVYARRLVENVHDEFVLRRDWGSKRFDKAVRELERAGRLRRVTLTEADALETVRPDEGEAA